ncbi:hypothetical protein [uncultured Microbulbifer sp.]|uniref:hypothetical protein n=1 Tax=uncultured Microbulbifer sp. TaxID=348147 RepID=UPI0025E4F168|nr:hypothetical protein [uncultured Microbulbifer sp.]
MSFQIRFDSDTRIVRAVFFGEVVFSEKVAAARQVAEKFGHLHPLNLIVDVRRAELLLTFKERQEFGSFAANLQGLKHARTAVLHAPDHNENLVIDSAALAQGFHLVEFITEAAAMEWLGADVPV